MHREVALQQTLQPQFATTGKPPFAPWADGSPKKKPPDLQAACPISLRSHHALGGWVMVVLETGLVLADLPIELVDQLVEGDRDERFEFAVELLVRGLEAMADDG